MIRISDEQRGLAEAAGCAALAISILAGKFGLGSSELLSARFWSTAAALILLLPATRRSAGIPASSWALLAFLAYMIVRSLWGGSDKTAGMQIDLVFLATQAALVTFVAQDRRLSIAFGCSILAIAGAYFALSLAGQVVAQATGNTRYGLGWGPIGTPVTFNRIQFLGFCLAMMFVPRFRALALLVATLFLYGTFASVQKAAFVAGGGALLLIAACLVSTRNWKNSIGLVAVVALSLLVFQLTYLDRLTERIDRAVQSSSTTVAATERVVAKEIEDTPALTGDLASAALSTIQVNYCLYDEMRELDCKEIAVADGSGRLLFLVEALRGWASSPLFGHGLGNFSVTSVHPTTFEPDSYYYPHNLFAEVAFSGGAIGLALMAVALIWAIRDAIWSRFEAPAKWYLLGFAAFLFVSTLFAGDIYDSRLLWLSFGFLAAYRTNQGTVLPLSSAPASLSDIPAATTEV